MKQGLNVSDIKKENRLLILNSVYSDGKTSRTQLAKKLALSKPAISDNLQPLLDLGIVSEVGEGSAGPAGGRKKIIVQFNPMYRYIISVDLSADRALFVLGNLNGEILNTHEAFMSPELSSQGCFDALKDGISILLNSLGAMANKVCSIAVAAPGSYNKEGELVFYNEFSGSPPWCSLNIKQLLSSAFGLPVIMYNDIKAAALGELSKGSWSGVKDMIYLSVGMGLGSGIILNGAPYMGENFSAGEIFDCINPLSSDKGAHIESMICTNYLKSRCAELKSSPFSRMSYIHLADIVRAYSEGQKDVVKIVDDICRRLAIMMFNYMNFISINHLFFAGDYAPFGDCFIKNLNKLFEKSSRPKPVIKITELGKYASIQGLFHLARQQYFTQICYE